MKPIDEAQLAYKKGSPRNWLLKLAVFGVSMGFVE
jgi:hypothetical protein